MGCSRRIVAIGVLVSAILGLGSCDDDRIISCEQPQQDTVYDTSLVFIRDYQYAEGRIFDLGYAGDFSPNDSICALRVYEERHSDSADQDSAYLQINPGATSSWDLLLRVKLVEPDKYEVRQDADRNIHIVVFGVRKYDGLGIYMEVDRYNQSGFVRRDTIGDVPESGALTLKMIRPSQWYRTPDHPTWPLRWRNCYPIPRAASPDDFTMRVLRGLPGTEWDSTNLDYQLTSDSSYWTYLEILGLDQYDTDGRRIPDGRVDDRPMVFMPDWGLLIFPHRTPFDTDTTFQMIGGGTTAPLEERVPSLYYYNSTQERAEASKYFIEIGELVPQNN